MKPNTLGIVLLMAVLVPAHAQSTQPQELSFGVVPQQSATKLARLWGPLLTYLSGHSGHRLKFRTAPNIPTFEQRVARQEYDFSYMNPYHFVAFNRQPGYRAVGRARDRYIRGIVVVAKNSSLEKLADLNGSELAFPAPLAFAATLLPQARMRQKGITFTPSYVSSHDSVYRAVAKGLYPAGGGILRTFNNVALEIRDQLRVLWTSERFTPHAFAVRPGIPVQVVGEVSEAMYHMHEDPEGLALLQAIGLKGIVPANDADWNDVRALDIRIVP